LKIKCIKGLGIIGLVTRRVTGDGMYEKRMEKSMKKPQWAEEIRNNYEESGDAQ